MALTENITQQASSASALLNSSPRENVARNKLELPEKDLFHKYILDKESQAATTGNSSVDQQALEHDSEIHSQQGMLTSRPNPNNPQQFTAKNTNGQTLGDQQQKVSQAGVLTPMQSDAVKTQQKIQTGKMVGQRGQVVTQEKTSGKTAKPVLEAKAQLAASKTANLTQVKSPATQKQLPLDQAKAAPPHQSIAKSRTTRQAQSSNSTIKIADPAPSTEQLLNKVEAKGENSETPSDQSGNQNQQNSSQSSKQEMQAHLQELYQQQQVQNTQENFSTQQVANAANSAQPNAAQGAYSGPVAQLAQQIFRMQESGGTSRVTLDMPDGEKLLVRINVRPNNGGLKVHLSTKSKGLQEALEKSWESLRVEASQRGIDLEAPEFDPIEGKDFTR
jgi:hypothetical protein